MILPLIGVILNLINQKFAWLFSYISNNKVFPLPLREEEERKLILKMEQGDMEARNTLIERNLRLVAHIVKKFDGYILFCSRYTNINLLLNNKYL